MFVNSIFDSVPVVKCVRVFLREKIGENHSYVMCFIMKKKILTIKKSAREERERAGSTMRYSFYVILSSTR